jgi:hypothetical protein
MKNMSVPRVLLPILLLSAALVILFSNLLPTVLGHIPGRMTGGGSIFCDGLRVTHGFELHCFVPEDDSFPGPNNLEINFEGNQFHLETLVTSECFDDPAIDQGNPNAPFDTMVGTGTGRYNGVSGATIEFTLTDGGEPGTKDTASYTIRDANGMVVLECGTTFLTFGNQQAHKANK